MHHHHHHHLLLGHDFQELLLRIECKEFEVLLDLSVREPEEKLVEFEGARLVRVQPEGVAFGLSEFVPVGCRQQGGSDA